MPDIQIYGLLPSTAYYICLIAPDGTAYRNDGAPWDELDTTSRSHYNASAPHNTNGIGTFIQDMPADLPDTLTEYGVLGFALSGGTPNGVYDGLPVFAGSIIWDGLSNVELSPTSILLAILAAAQTFGASSSTSPADVGSAYDAVTVDTAVYWSQAFVSPAHDVTGWARMAFTVKRNAETDDDSDALLTVRASNPAAPATDGVLTFNRRAIATDDPIRGMGAIAVEALAPDARARVTLNPGVTALPPSPTNEPYVFEIDVWDGGGVKRELGRGEFGVRRSVRRAVAAP